MEEGEISHFEAMLTPVGDQTMRVEWFYKGEALKASSRVRTVYAFGMVVLEVTGSKVSKFSSVNGVSFILFISKICKYIVLYNVRTLVSLNRMHCTIYFFDHEWYILCR